MYFKIEEKNDSIKYYQNEIDSQEEKGTTNTDDNHPDLAENLSPLPNSQLNSRDLEKVNKKLNLDGTISIDSVVSYLFKVNPSDIAKKYSNQKNAYIKALRELNTNSFQDKQDTYYLSGDLKYVPIYMEK
jgi:hypothetical protein